MMAEARNVVLISVDTLRYDCLGVCPHKVHLQAWDVSERLSTPNLDDFVRSGLYFTQAVTTAPVTVSAHASVMTGLYPGRHGARGQYKWRISDDVTTLAEDLRGRGYRTLAVQEEGERTCLRTGSRVLSGFDEFFTDEQAAASSCRGGDAPVLLFIHTFDVHMPYCWSYVADVRAHNGDWRDASAEVSARTGVPAPTGDGIEEQTEFFRLAGRRARQSMGPDEAVRMFLAWYVRGVNWFDRVRWPALVDALRRAELLDDALVVLFGDHGESALPDSPGSPTGHAPSLLDDALRVPLVLRGPGIGADQVGRQVSLVDVVPTVMEYLGLADPAVGLEGRTDGSSLFGEPDGTEPLHLAEAWTHGAIDRPDARAEPHFFANVRAPWVPYQACARRGVRKAIWHPGPPILGRFQHQGPRSGVLARAAARLRRGLARHRPAAHGASSADGAAEWREAASYGLDLARDPLELHPVPLGGGGVRAHDWSGMLDAVRQYWQAGRCGPLIDLEADEMQAVTRNLRNLGYLE
jgi:hypothetical protein